MNGNEALRDRFEQLKRQHSKADIEEFVEKNKEVKKEFEEYRQDKEEERVASDFLVARPEVQKKFEEAKKKNQDLTAKDFLQKTTDQKVMNEFERFEEQAKVKKATEEREKETKKTAMEFVSASERLKKEFKQRQKGNPRVTFEEFVEEKVKESSETKRDFEQFLLQKQEAKDYEVFLEANPELNKLFQKKREQGDVTDARDFVQNNTTLAKKFEEYREENIDELNTRKFVETNADVKSLFEEFRAKQGGQEATYEDFMKQNRKARDLFERDVLYNPDSALNMDKFLLQHKEAREAVAATDGERREVGCAGEQRSAPRVRRVHAPRTRERSGREVYGGPPRTEEEVREGSQSQPRGRHQDFPSAARQRRGAAEVRRARGEAHRAAAVREWQRGSA